MFSDSGFFQEMPVACSSKSKFQIEGMNGANHYNAKKLQSLFNSI